MEKKANIFPASFEFHRKIKKNVRFLSIAIILIILSTPLIPRQRGTVPISRLLIILRCVISPVGGGLRGWIKLTGLDLI
jgi:hypothetical protein